MQLMFDSDEINNCNNLPEFIKCFKNKNKNNNNKIKNKNNKLNKKLRLWKKNQ